MASSSKQELSSAQVIQLVYDYDNQLRQAVEAGMESVRETMRRIGPGLKTILPINSHVNATLPDRVFLFKFISAWNILSIRNSPAFVELLRAEALKINPIPQPTSPTAIPAAAPTARLVATTSAAEPSIPPAVPTPSAAEASASTTAVTKAVNCNLAGMKFVPPKAAARDDTSAIPTPSKPAESKPAASIPAASQPATSKPAVAESKEKSRPKPTSRNTKVDDDGAEDFFEVNWETDNNIEEDELPDEEYKQPDEENDHSAGGSGSHKRRRRIRRQPVKLSAIHKPSCDRCERRKRTCYKEAGGGACYSCVLFKSRCDYSKSNHKERDVKEIKGEAKEKVRTLRRSRVLVGDEIEDSFEVNWESGNNIEEDDEQPDDDDEQPDEDNDQPAESSGGHKRRRRKPVELDAIHKPSCDSCVQGKRKCSKEAGGGACYSCVLLKSRCDYSKSNPKERDVKDIKGKEKEKVRTPRRSKVFVGDEIDIPRINDLESNVSFIVPEDENEKEIKQPARRMKPAPREDQGVLNGIQSQLWQMNGEMHDNFDTCDVMSGRVQYLESEMWRLKNLGSEMKEVKRLLHEVLRRLPEEDHSVVTVGDDEMKVTFARKIARPTFPTVARKTARPSTAATITAAQPVDTTAVASSSVAAPAAEYIESAVPHDNPGFGNLSDVSASFTPLNSPRLYPASFTPPPNPFSAALNSFEDLPYVPIESLILEDTPWPSPQPPSSLPNIRGPDSTSDSIFSSLPPSNIPAPTAVPSDFLKPRTSRSRFQGTSPPSPDVKRKADNTGTGRVSKRRK